MQSQKGSRMTTTATQSGPVPNTDDRRVDAGALPSSSRAHRRWTRPVLIGSAVLTLGAIGYFTLGSIAGGNSLGDAGIYTVKRRSFPVLLREKGELKAAKSVDLKCKVEGRSTIIWLIDEGTQVKEGELLVRLASDQIEEKIRSEEIKDANASAAASAAESEHEILIDQNASDLRKAELTVQLAEIELEKYLEGDWIQKQLDLRLELERCKKVHERAKTDYEDSLVLRKAKYISKGKLLQHEFDEYQARHDVDKAALRKKIEETYTHQQDLQKRQSDLEEAKKELERIRKSNTAKKSKSAASLQAKRAEYEMVSQRLAKFREQQANCEMRAPQDGLVVYDTGSNRWDRRQIAEGSEVFERQTIIKLPDPSVMVVTVRIHEAKTDKIKLGQIAQVEVEGVPGQVFTGRVTKIAVLADSQNQWLNPDLKEYETEITLDQNDAPLKPGVTARADIIVAQMDNILAVPIQCVFSKSGHHFVFKVGRRGAEPVEVEPGTSSDEFVELLTGVASQDRVLLAINDDQRRSLPELEPPKLASNGGPPGGEKQSLKKPGQGAGQRKGPSKGRSGGKKKGGSGRGKSPGKAG
ncbi:MAG: efflux RND transporter periplasmic adaptor subunit [Planctomycetes bacterium]|nr:efflux RND transporter periplasmic adaptor subunit [Planctomycetota bacterium]